MYPLRVALRTVDARTGQAPDGGAPAAHMEISRGAAACELRERAAAVLGLKEADLRLWELANGGSTIGARVEVTAPQLPDAVRRGCAVAVETKKSDGTWPRDALSGPSDRTFPASQLLYRGRSSSADRPALPDGCVGLRNIGNTCFMASAIQCLSNTNELTRHFTSGAYESDVNKDNVLGHGGEMALAYANLMKQLWGGAAGGSSVNPFEIKYLIGKRREEFRGYAQQDSQELLAFLLDGLHEDLNRVRERPPYREQPDDDGDAPPQPDDEAAADAWRDHAERNSSVVVDLFQGQLKSRLVCPRCSHVSVTFDPVMYLSLPLPGRGRRTLPLILVPLRGRPMRVRVKLQRGASAADALVAVGHRAGLRPGAPLVAAEVKAGRIAWVLPADASVDSFMDPAHGRGASAEVEPTLYAYELCHKAPEPPRKSTSFGSSLLAFCVAPMTNNSVAISDSDSREGNVAIAVHLRVASEASAAAANGNGGGSNNSSPVGFSSWMSFGSSQAEPSSASVGYPLLLCLPKEGLTSAGLAREARAAAAAALEAAGGVASGAPAEADDIAMEVEWQRSRSMSDVTMADDDEFTDAVNARSLPHASLLLCPRSGSERGTAFPEEDESGAPTISDSQALVLEWPADARGPLSPLLPPAFDEHPSWREESAKPGEEQRLGEVLQAYTREEKLARDNMWRCPKCKEPQEATKQLSLWRAPRILCLHLKRFSSGRYTRDKLDSFVQYPLEGLALDDVMAFGADLPRATYSLFAVSCHMGGLGGGHYTAYGKNANDGQWYYFNDESVSRCRDASEAVTRSAYLLFYRLDDEHTVGKTERLL